MCREFLLNVIMLQFPPNCYCYKLWEASTSLRGRHKVDKVGIPNVKHRYLEHRSPLAWIPRSLVDFTHTISQTVFKVPFTFQHSMLRGNVTQIWKLCIFNNASPFLQEGSSIPLLAFCIFICSTSQRPVERKYEIPLSFEAKIGVNVYEMCFHMHIWFCYFNIWRLSKPLTILTNNATKGSLLCAIGVKEKVIKRI